MADQYVKTVYKDPARDHSLIYMRSRSCHYMLPGYPSMVKRSKIDNRNVGRKLYRQLVLMLKGEKRVNYVPSV